MQFKSNAQKNSNNDSDDSIPALLALFTAFGICEFSLFCLMSFASYLRLRGRCSNRCWRFVVIFDKAQFDGSICEHCNPFETLPSAHDERAFSFLKGVKTYLRSTMSEKRLSNLACISVNRERVSSLTLRELQEPFLNKKTRKIFKWLLW